MRTTIHSLAYSRVRAWFSRSITSRLRYVFVPFFMVMWLSPIILQAQLSGVVRDAKSLIALPGASVQLQQSSLATTTDADGRFRFETAALSGSYTLEVRFLGYSVHTEVLEFLPNEPLVLDIRLEPTTIEMASTLLVRGIRAQGVAPTTFTVLNKAAIEKADFGQDLPILLRTTPSVVSTSDAGAGVGYTGLRIRGSDPTRINVTINGIPINDAESQGVFWVNMPDISRSVSDIEIQRGVGTSTNGAGAFGATVSLQTDDLSEEAFGQVTNGFGSFNTRRHTLEWNTGRMNDHWFVGGRVSKIASDGYIDRARSDLQSYYLSAAYANDKTVVKFVTFAGAEETYQAWWGTPEARLNNDREGMLAVIGNNGYTEEQAQNLLNDGRTFNYYTYENEVDNYKQDHYQLHLSHSFSQKLDAYLGVNYTYGRGYFEQFRSDEDFSDYALNRPVGLDASIETTDLIRRRWLDNDSYVAAWNLNYRASARSEFIFGGSYQDYLGDHYGEIIWSEFAAVPIRQRYYEGVGDKTDGNTYLKWLFNPSDQWRFYTDVQIRQINYVVSGTDNDLRALDEDLNWTFFNPKAGLRYIINDQSELYGSFAVAHREPVRSDIIDAPAALKPKAERLYNYELGYKYERSNLRFSANYYLMLYTDQLVVTGQLNDVGANIRQNVDRSYRTGLELESSWRLTKRFQMAGNLSFSQNRIDRFVEYLYDYGADFSEFNVITNTYKNTDIALSPNIIGNLQLSYQINDAIGVDWISKYVGKQFLDNTSNEDRALDAYFINDIQLGGSWSTSVLPKISANFVIRNVFDHLFENNGYTFGYFAGLENEIRENYLYPQAGRHVQLQISIGF